MKLRDQLKCELARRDFWEYNKLESPDFYKEDRLYLKQMSKEIQDFTTNDYDVLMIHEPPRHGKSRTVGNAVKWILGNDPTTKIITASYNERVSSNFSVLVRNAIMTQKVDDKIIFSDIWPNVFLSRDSKAKNLWRLQASAVPSYLATSPKGSATSMGCDYLIIDDPIKGDSDARNEQELENHWSWFKDTMLSRLEGKRKILIVMTRWATGDLAGKAEEHFQSIGMKVKIINMKAFDGEKMLCEEVLSYEDYLNLEKTMSPDVFNANYNQEPIDIKGRLYADFMEYDSIDKNKIVNRIAYIDTADEGDDYLAGFFADVDSSKNIYITDTIYTKEAMEITEGLTALKLLENNTNYAHIESNNGGRGFSRAVKKETRELGNNKTIFKDFHQSQNKKARILTNSTGVMNTVFFPRNWRERWPELARDLFKYQREGKNKHDDGPDALTGIYEKVSAGITQIIY